MTGPLAQTLVVMQDRGAASRSVNRGARAVQDAALSGTGVDVLCDASYYAPDKALPLICTRFEVRAPGPPLAAPPPPPGGGVCCNCNLPLAGDYCELDDAVKCSKSIS